MFENEVYPGIPALLAYLQQQGSLLLLATGKPQPYAWRILQHFDLLRHFTLVGGATLDGTVSTKTQVIAALLPRLAEVAEVERSACVMVGDREHDIAGARAHRLPCIAVSYGYGSMHELTACAPDRLVHSVAELRALLAPCPDTGDNHERL
jgi:phosphoglycolate phosphatase